MTDQWRDVEAQEEMWRHGGYRYLEMAPLGVRFAMAAWFIRALAPRPWHVADLDAGCGDVFSWLRSAYLETYYFVDAAETACVDFEARAGLDTCVRILRGTVEERIEELDRAQLTAVVALGLVGSLLSEETILRLFQHCAPHYIWVAECSTQQASHYAKLQSLARWKVGFDFERNEPASHRVFLVGNDT